MKHVRMITFGFVFLLGAVALGQQTNVESTTPAADAKQPAQVIDHNEVDDTFNLSLHNADVRVVMLQLSENAQRTIVVSPAIQGNLTADFYGVTFDEAIESISKVMDFICIKEGKRLLVYTLAEWDKKQEQMSARIYRLNNISAKEASELLGGLLSAKGSIKMATPRNVGLKDDSEEALEDHAAQDVLVVKDIEGVLVQFDKMIPQLDRLPAQVLIEATILSVKLDDTNALGVDLSILGGHTNMNRMGMESTLSGLPTMGGEAPGITNFSRIAGGATTSTTGLVPAGGLSLSLVSNNIAMFIRALETTSDTTILANPKLLVVNRCLGEVNVGKEQGYTSGSETTSSATSTQTEILETGTILKVRPFIGKDGKIRMIIRPEISDGVIVEKGGLALPESEVSKVTTEVIVNDGKTIVIGGLFQEKTVLVRNQIPLLGTLPQIGAMFRSHKDQVVRSELIVLITPHIIGYEEAEAASKQVMDYIDRARLGARRGLKWWGRNPRSDMFMTMARKAVASGDRTKGRWMLSMALANTPLRGDAIEMAQRLNGWDLGSEEPTLFFVETMLKLKAPPALKKKKAPAAKRKPKRKPAAKLKAPPKPKAEAVVSAKAASTLLTVPVRPTPQPLVAPK